MDNQQSRTISPPNIADDTAAAAVSQDIHPPSLQPPDNQPPNETVDSDGPSSQPLESESEEDFPYYLTCAVWDVPPLDAYYFPEADTNEYNNEKVIGYNALYRCIATPGIVRAATHWIHPITRTSYKRDEALRLARRVPTSIQERINRQRMKTDPPLPMEPDDELTEDDRQRYNWTISQVTADDP